MVLTLANGGVYFFQAGTEELVNEWVSTCNYWAARQSKEPLAGGVSNMEYGWNRVADLASHGRSMSEDQNPRAETDNMSVRSGRSSRSKFGRKDNAATMRTSPWSDRVFINDWKPPMPSTVPSTHDEEAQLDALRKHVTALKNDLKGHNNLREPMVALVSVVLRIFYIPSLSSQCSINLVLQMRTKRRAIGRRSRNISLRRLSNTNPTSILSKPPWR
jgi:PH and SEC7 domain-containing protein